MIGSKNAYSTEAVSRSSAPAHRIRDAWCERGFRHAIGGVVLEPRSNSGNVADPVGSGGCHSHTVRTADAPRTTQTVCSEQHRSGVDRRACGNRQERGAAIRHPHAFYGLHKEGDSRL